MRTLIALTLCALCCLAGARAQETTTSQEAAGPATPTAGARPSEARVALDAQATAYDIAGRVALTARLRTTSLAGTPDSPERNSRLVVENRSPVFYTYASGWATFYGGDGVRCGEGAWKLEALAPGESAEVDTPGLRLTCTPATWRIVAANLLTRTTDVAKPADEGAPPAAEQPATQASPQSSPPSSPLNNLSSSESESSSRGARGVPALEINVNGKTIPIQLGNPLEIVVGGERVRIVVQPVP
ncbi:MAG TPA: hypothetical protein VER32_13630 [Pyrinomonadaceae bacterium]|nr:hypothetical protein [Pyrinomonadaceae bacterium]